MGTVNAGLLGPVPGEADYLAGMSQIADTANISVALNLIMESAAIRIAVALYPALEGESPTLAIAGIAWLGLVSVGSAFVQAGQPEGSFYQTLAALFLDGSTVAFTIAAEIFSGPIALNEMVLAVWLIAKGKL